MSKRKNKKKNTFGEQYEVTFDYQKPDGYWVISDIVTVSVPVVHGSSEKRNHFKAEEIARSMFSHPINISKTVYC